MQIPGQFCVEINSNGSYSPGFGTNQWTPGKEHIASFSVLILPRRAQVLRDVKAADVVNNTLCFFIAPTTAKWDAMIDLVLEACEGSTHLRFKVYREHRIFLRGSQRDGSIHQRVELLAA